MTRYNQRMIGILAVYFAVLQPALAQTTELVSVSSEGIQGNLNSQFADISDDGRYVVFMSMSTNLIDFDENGLIWDVYLHDRNTRGTEIISISTEGIQSNDQSENPAVSDNGNLVVLSSRADNLIPNDTNEVSDIFLRIRGRGETVRVNISDSGVQGNGNSWNPVISANGRFLAYHSFSDNLVTPDHNGPKSDIFFFDARTEQTRLLSISSGGIQGNGHSFRAAISETGRFVAFESMSDNLIENDTNGATDIFLHDLVTGVTEIVSISSSGELGNNSSFGPSISNDGRFVAFNSRANNLVSDDVNGVGDVFVRDRVMGETIIVSLSGAGQLGNGSSSAPDISADGRFVTFHSLANNLTDTDVNGSITDIFIHDRDTGETSIVSVAPDGVQANNVSEFPAISGDGRYVAFDTRADNLGFDDTNLARDIYVRDRGVIDEAPTVRIVSPNDGSVVSGLILVQVEAIDVEDSLGTLKVGVLTQDRQRLRTIYNVETELYETEWSTTVGPDGIVSMISGAIDSYSNVSRSARIRVDVDNVDGSLGE